MNRLIPLAVSLLVMFVLQTGIAYAQEDITPPSLLDVSFEPETIDTSKGPQTITVTVHVTDDLSGIKHVAMNFRKPETTQRAQVEFRPEYMPNDYFGYWLSGDNLNGQYTNTITIPQYAAFGEWEMYNVTLEDNVGNRIDHSKPEDEGESLTGDNPEWPSLFNGFDFIVGAADTPQEPQQPAARLFMPMLNH